MPRFAPPLLLVVALSVVVSAVVAAQSRGVVPPPSWARSVEVIDDGAVIHRAPRAGAPRRGTVKIGTRLPLVRRLAGDGCETGVWFEVGRDAFVCEAAVAPSRQLAGGEPQPVAGPGDLLPYTYAFVGFDGTRAFAHPSDYDADQYSEAFGEGFGLTLLARTRYAGLTFFQTRRGLWVEASSLRFARGSTFGGVELGEGDPLDVAWVRRADARVVERPRGRVARRAGRREVLHVAAEGPRGWLALTDGTFVRTTDVARARLTPRPEGVGETEKWIDVDVDQQVMTAYVGDRAAYATLVSTGRAARALETPRGTFRIWVKLATSDMDDLERDDVEQNYSIESVPWVQYFEGSNGFHTAFWHDDFGRRRSHGCVNLSPTDARWLFSFTGPALPDGYTAILPTDADRGTIVHVR